MSIIHQYEIKFFKRNIYDRVYYGMTSVHIFLDQIITDDQTIIDIDETLDAVNSLLNREINLIDYTSQSLNTIRANSTTTTIYNGLNFETGALHFSLPTSDFKSIVEAWKNYVTHN